MTAEAQTALRRIMETYSQITRFCFICNYVNKIINPISSRCAIFRFKKISRKLVEQRLEYICKQEKCNSLIKIIPTISFNTRGDLRQSIIILESIKKCINKNHISNICNTIPIEKIKIKFTNFQEMKNYIDNLFFDSFNLYFLMENIKTKILTSDYTDGKKANLLIKLNICQTKIFQDCNEKLQLYHFFSNLIN